jgi:hypothetical protein
MVDRCSELLCLKENIWENIDYCKEFRHEFLADKIKIFKSNDKYLAILYDMFYFEDFKNIISKLDKKVIIYAFSHYKIDLDDFSELKIPFEIEEIPDPILEVYEKIFLL